MHSNGEKTLNWSLVTTALSERARSDLGGTRCQNHAPFPSSATAERLRRKIAEALRLYTNGSTVHSLVSGTQDPSSHLERAARDAILMPAEIWVCGHFMQSVGLIGSELRAARALAPDLAFEFETAPSTPSLCTEITKSISSEGLILDTASPELARLRRQRAERRSAFESQLESKVKEWHAKGLLQDKFYDVMDGRFVVPLKVEQQSKLDGVLVGRSNTGQSVFVEPLELTTANNELKELELSIRSEELRILRELSTKIGSLWNTYKLWIDPLAEFDLVFAAAIFARDFKLTKPVVSERKLVLRNLFHLELLSRGVEPVKNSFSLETEVSNENSRRCILISGPNTGGKTVLIKAAGLAALMAQAGLYVPADDGSTLPFYKNVYALIGDDQSIAAGLSSFSAQIQELKRVLDSAASPSLIVVDEILSSTDPEEASALAQAFIEECLLRGHHLLVTSHFSELSARVRENKHAAVGAMEFRNGQPTYELRLDELGSSHAIEVAARLGFPSKLLKRAKELVSQGKVDYQSALSELRAKEAHLEAEHAKEVARLQKENKNLKERLEAFLKESEEKIRSAIDQALKTIAMERARKTSSVSISARLRAQTDSIAAAATEELSGTAEENFGRTLGIETVKEKKVAELKVGSNVRLRDKRYVHGSVLEIDAEKGTATVQFGILKMEKALTELEPLAEPEKRHRFTGIEIEAPKSAAPFSKKLDLRGRRYDDAIAAAESFLDNALRAGCGSVTIITGHGTGAIKNGLKELLGRLPYVSNFRGERENDDGAIVVDLD